MLAFLQKLIIIFCVITAVTSVYYSLRISKENKITNKEDSKEEKPDIKWKNNFSAILAISVIGLFLFLLIYLNFNISNWIFIPFVIYVMLKQSNEVVLSFSILKSSISIKNNSFLTKKEKSSIILLAMSITFFSSLNVPFVIINFSKKISPDILSDWISFVIMVFMFTIYFFLIVILLKIFIDEILVQIKNSKKRFLMQMLI